MNIPDDLHATIRKYDQEHLLQHWAHLDEAQQQRLLDQLRDIDFALLRELFRDSDALHELPPPDLITPITSERLDPRDDGKRAVGEQALRAGQVAALVVAGGQGTRLGFDAPKGMYPIGPVSGHSLFQIFAEKVLALRRRYDCFSLPLLVMTSPITDEPTRAFFESERYFGLPREEVLFFCQGTMPALDSATGRLLLSAKDQLCLSPNGHGGVLPALRDAGLLNELSARGIRDLFYFQIDNALVKVADPLFIGHHRQYRAEVSTKAIPKSQPTEKVGNLALVDDRCTIIEYSDLPDELTHARDEQTRLRFALGNTAVHIFDVDFLQCMAGDDASLPFHAAKKKMPYLDETGKLIEPAAENACKFEKFIFDVLPRAERWTVVEIDITEEYAPLKNKTGEHSPEHVRRAISNLARQWLTEAHSKVSGNDEAYVEISPLFALDACALAERIKGEELVQPPRYFREDED